MKFDPKTQCAREMLTQAQPLLEEGKNYLNDEVGILCNFIDGNEGTREDFAKWLEYYISDY